MARSPEAQIKRLPKASMRPTGPAGLASPSAGASARRLAACARPARRDGPARRPGAAVGLS